MGDTVTETIEIVSMMDGDEGCGFFADGHHDPALFLRAARAQGYCDDEPTKSDEELVQHWQCTRIEGEDGVPRYSRIRVGEGVPVTVLVY